MTVATAILLQSLVALYLTRDGWFTLDSWHYILTRGGVPEADLGLWAPVGGHWQTTIVVLYRILFEAFGVRHFLPYIAVNIALHAAVTALTYMVLRRSGASGGQAAFVGVVVACLGAGSEVFLWDGPVPLVGALALGLLALLLIMQLGPGLGGTAAASAALLLAVMTSGVGAVVLAVTTVFVLLERGWRSSVAVCGPAAVCLAGWFVAIGRHAGRVDTRSEDYLKLPEYVWTGLTFAVQSAVGVPALGAVLLVVLLGAPLIASQQPSALVALAWAGNVGAVVQLALSGSAGLVFGVTQATQSRYAYIVLVLMAPSLALLAGEAWRRARPTPGWLLASAALVGFIMYAANALAIEIDQASRAKAFGSISKKWAFGTVAAHRAGEEVLTPHSTGLASLVDARGFTRPEISGQMPGANAPQGARLAAESEFFVGVAKTSYGRFAPVDMRFGGGFVGTFKNSAGCGTYVTVGAGELLVQTHDGVEIGVNGPSDEVTTQVSRSGVTGPTRVWAVQPGNFYVATTAKQAELKITLNQSGAYVICTN